MVYSTDLGKGITVAGAALAFLTLLGVVTALFYDNHWNWFIYAVIVGGVCGLVVGLVVHVAVPVKVQIAALGACFGLTADFVTGLLSKVEHPSTVINVAANWIADATNAINSGLGQTGLPALDKPPLAVGLWAFLLVFGVLLLFGAFNKDQT